MYATLNQILRISNFFFTSSFSAFRMQCRVQVSKYDADDAGCWPFCLPAKRVKKIFGLVT